MALRKSERHARAARAQNHQVARDLVRRARVDVPEIETRPNVISWFDIEDLMETRCDVTGERQEP